MNTPPRFSQRALSLSGAFLALVATATTASAADATWNGTTNGTWATATNWSASPAPGTTQTATFNNAGNGNTTLDLGTGVTVTNILFDTGSAAYTIGNGGVGAQTLQLGGGGKVTLASGVTADQTINANLKLGADGFGGNTQFTNNSATAILTLAGSLNAPTATKTMTFNGAGLVVAAGSYAYGGVMEVSAGKLSLSGSLQNNGAGVSLRASSTGTFEQTASSVISGVTSVVVNAAGGGTNLLSGSNSYTGSTSVQAGVLRVTHNDALGSSAGGTSVSAGGQLQLVGGITIASEVIDLRGGGISDTGALRNISGDNTLGGEITASGSPVRINSDSGTLTLSGTFTNGHNINLILGGAGNIAFTGNITNGGGSRTVVKDGSGIATLSGTNTYNGATTVSDGILTFARTSAKATNTVTAQANGTIGLGVGGTGYYSSANVDSLFANTLTGFSMNAASGVAIDTSAGDFVYATNQNAARALTKLGANSLTLSGNSGYTGATTVKAGKLIVSGSLTSTASARVDSGAELNVNGLVNTAATVSVSGTLSGSGRVGAVTLTSGGVLSPGNSAGILNIASLTGAEGAILSIEIGKAVSGFGPVAGVDYDQINSAGGVNLNGMTLSLSLTGNNNLQGDDLFFIILNGSGEAVQGTFAGLAQDAIFEFESEIYQISYTANWTGDYGTSTFTGGNHVAIQLIPEPSTYVFVALGMSALAMRLRRRSAA